MVNVLQKTRVYFTTLAVAVVCQHGTMRLTHKPHTCNIVAAPQTCEVDAKRLERDFQAAQWHVVEQRMLARGVDDDLRRNAAREMPEKFHQRCDVVYGVSFRRLVHLGNAVNLPQQRDNYNLKSHRRCNNVSYESIWIRSSCDYI